MVPKTWPRPFPSGECWCGCGAEVSSQTFWVTGHDKFAESWVISTEYGTVVDFLAAHGFRPGGRNARGEHSAQKRGS